MKPLQFAAIPLFLVLVAAAMAGENPSGKDNVGSNLPPRVRGLLIQEMNAILGATRNILDGLVRGQHAVVASNAQAIHDSFILEQQMTEKDRQALMRAVPERFIERDRAFHQLSASLAEAARNGNSARQRALFADMVEACAACHTHHARQRFPGFAEGSNQAR